MNKILIAIALCILVFVGMAAFLSTRKQNIPVSNISTPLVVASSMPSQPIPESQATPTPANGFVDPVANFKQRVTKKFFGTYVTPNNSPVQPEKFTGYHTGADAEYGDVIGDVPVYAIADGTVLVARWASGYGGVIAIQHRINNQSVIAVYGHVNPNQLPKVGVQVIKGQKIDILGQGFSHETDGERKHLHFGLVKGTTFTLLGYVASKSQLSTWIDPLTIL